MSDLETTEIALAAELLAMDAEALEAFLLLHPQQACPVTHHFGPGVYMREAAMPAGAIIVGHAHRDESLNIMLKGRMVLVMDGETRVVEAPFMAISKPGRKAAYVLEDTVWVNVYATTETDIAVLEARYVDKSPAFRAHQQMLEGAA